LQVCEKSPFKGGGIHKEVQVEKLMFVFVKKGKGIARVFGGGIHFA